MCYVLKKRIQVSVLKCVRLLKNKETFISTVFEIHFHSFIYVSSFLKRQAHIFASTKVSHSRFGI